MKTPFWIRHWRTTTAGMLLGMWTLLSSSNDVTTITWSELAERVPKAAAIVLLGVLARDFEKSEHPDEREDPHG